MTHLLRPVCMMMLVLTACLALGCGKANEAQSKAVSELTASINHLANELEQVKTEQDAMLRVSDLQAAVGRVTQAKNHLNELASSPEAAKKLAITQGGLSLASAVKRMQDESDRIRTMLGPEKAQAMSQILTPSLAAELSEPASRPTPAP